VKAPMFLASLRDRDIQVWAEGDRLRCSAPTGTLTPELREELRQRKDEVLKFLQSAGSIVRQSRGIVPLQPRGTYPPVFAFGGHNGDVFCFRFLAQHIGEDQPFFGLQPPGLDDQKEPLERVEDLAAYFAAEIRAFRPNGPYVIAGYCAGGTIAFELARQLLRNGAAVSTLALFGAPYPTSYRLLPQLRRRFVNQVARAVKHARALASLPAGEKRSYIAEKLRNARLDPVLVQRSKVARATFLALRRYVPGYFDGPLSLFVPCRQWAGARDELMRWRAVAKQVQEYFGPDTCNGDVMLREPYVSTFAGLFRQCRVKRAGRESSSSSRPIFDHAALECSKSSVR
jgi:thioesterase domain-containing protein